jgi:hypothetical protein
VYIDHDYYPWLIGMGQGYIGAATLHHLEIYHVQSLELGTLMSDLTRVRVINDFGTATSDKIFVV